MLDYRLSQQEIQSLQDFIEGKDDNLLFTDLPERVFRLSEAVRRKSLEVAKSSRQKLSAAERRLSRLQDRREDAIDASDFRCLGVSTLDLAQVILHYVRQRNLRVSTEVLMFLIYDTYANWLLSNREKITIEDPVCQPKGIWFWSITGKLNWNKVDAREEFERIAAVDKGILAVARQVVAAHAHEETSNVVRYVTRLPQWKTHCADKTDGKWNHAIPDADTYRWKESTKRGAEQQ